MDLVLLSALFGGGGGGLFGGFGGGRRGGRYGREVVIPPTESEALIIPPTDSEALTVSEIDDAESLPIMTDDNKQVVQPTTHTVNKRQLNKRPIGAAVSPFAGVAAPVPAPVPVSGPVPGPLPVPMPVPVSNPIMDLVLLSALFGGGGGGGLFGGFGGGFGGGRRGGRYNREVVIPPTESEALTVSELDDAESLPIMTDDNKEVVQPTTHTVNKRQLPLGAAVSPLAGAAAPLAAPVPVPVAGGFGLGMAGSPILNLILLSSIFGGNGGNGRRYNRNRDHDIFRRSIDDQPEAEQLVSEADALNVVDPQVTDEVQRVKRQLVPPIGGGLLAPLAPMGGSPILDLVLLSALYGDGGLFGGNDMSPRRRGGRGDGRRG